MWKKGHIASVCRSRKKGPRPSPAVSLREQYVKDDESGYDEDLPIKLVGSRQLKSRPIAVLVLINGKELNMELDTGAAVSIFWRRLLEKNFRTLFLNLLQSLFVPTLYTGQRMSVVGQLTVLIKYQSQSHSLPLLIVAGDGPSLFGRDWLRHITLDWKTIGLASMDQPNVQLNSLLQAYYFT